MQGRGVLIVVAARGGSKGLPRKNARTLGDIPLLGWTAQAVRESGLTDAVCVLSTDDPELADIGRSVGLDVPFMRPAMHATDDASAEAVALHALDWISSHRPAQIDTVMWLQPTSPFRPPSALSGAVALYRERGDSISAVIGVKAIHRTLRTLFRADENQLLAPLDANVTTPNLRQAAEPLFTPNGALYLASAAALRKERSFFVQPCAGIVMDAVASVDIDDATDFEIAEAIALAGKSWRGPVSGPRPAPPV